MSKTLGDTPTLILENTCPGETMNLMYKNVNTSMIFIGVSIILKT